MINHQCCCWLAAQDRNAIENFFGRWWDDFFNSEDRVEDWKFLNKTFIIGRRDPKKSAWLNVEAIYSVCELRFQKEGIKQRFKQLYRSLFGIWPQAYSRWLGLTRSKGISHCFLCGSHEGNARWLASTYGIGLYWSSLLGAFCGLGSDWLAVWDCHVQVSCAMTLYPINLHTS